MNYSRTINNRWQFLNFRRNRANHLPQQTSSRIFVSLAAILLIAASAGFGALFAWRTGSKHDLVLGVLSVAMALGLEIAKPFAVAGAFASLREWRLLQAVALGLTGLLAIGYSLQAELTFMAMTRGDLVAERAGDADTVKKAVERYQRADAELSKLDPARPAATLQAEIDGLLLQPGINGCIVIDGPKTSAICPKVAELRAELARAQRRVQLEGIMGDAEAERQSAPVVSAPDPGATALATYAESFGLKIDPDRLGLWLPLIGVLALEIGAAFSVVLVRATGQRATPVPAEAPEIGREPLVSHPDEPPKDDDDTPSEPPRINGLEKLIKGPGYRGSQRALARQLGTSRRTLQRTLQALAEAGRAHYETSKQGIVFAVA